MSRDPVAYTYQADILCQGCARQLGITEALKLGAATMWGDSGTAEETLAEWASYAAVNRHDESSFDSGDFPKTVFSNMVEGYEHCGQCRDCIDHDPNRCGRVDAGRWRW